MDKRDMESSTSENWTQDLLISDWEYYQRYQII